MTAYSKNSTRSAYGYTGLVCQRTIQYRFVSLWKTIMPPEIGLSRKSVDVQLLVLETRLGRLPRHVLHHLIANGKTQSLLAKTAMLEMTYLDLTQPLIPNHSMTPMTERVSPTHIQEQSILLGLFINVGGL